MKRILKKFDKFETHHRVLVFALILIGTIIFTRLLVLVYNPNPILFGVEIHHFDYGIFLLLISSALLLIEPKKYNNINLIFSAIASALILDEYWMIRENVVENTNLGIRIYNSSFPSVIILSVVTLIVILFFNSILQRK